MNEDWKVKESEGTYNGAPIYCPINDWDCPYYDKGICYIKDPIEECDDFGAFFETWENWENS